MAGVFSRFSDSNLACCYAGSLRTLGAVFYVKRNGLAFSQHLESVSLDSREVNKHVFAAVFRRDETETFGFVEPLYSTCRHFDLPLK